MYQLTIRLPASELDRLRYLAEQKDRPIRNQAERLLRQALTPDAAQTPPADRVRSAGGGVGAAPDLVAAGHDEDRRENVA